MHVKPRHDPHVFSMLFASVPAKKKKDGVSVSNNRLKNKALPGATSVTYIDKKMLRYI